MLPLGEILAKLKSTYCGPIGVEVSHIQDGERRRWLQERVESCGLRPAYDAAARRRFLRSIVQAEQFERFLHKTFVGAKRFSVEGGEVMLSALDQVIHRAPGFGVTDLVIGIGSRVSLPLQAWGSDENLKLIRIDLDPEEICRYKQPDVDVSKLSEFTFTDANLTYRRATTDFKFATAVASFARWSGEGFGEMDGAQTIRIVAPATLGLILGFQTVLSSLFWSLLGIETRPAPVARTFVESSESKVINVQFAKGVER